MQRVIFFVAGMDLEYREGIACMNLGLFFSSSLHLVLFLGYPRHLRFTYFFRYDELAASLFQEGRPSLLHTWAPPGGDL